MIYIYSSSGVGVGLAGKPMLRVRDDLALVGAAGGVGLGRTEVRKDALSVGLGLGVCDGRLVVVLVTEPYGSRGCKVTRRSEVMLNLRFARNGHTGARGTRRERWSRWMRRGAAGRARWQDGWEGHARERWERFP